ncbi:MAG: 4-(cytidine 5'-diphospho)-2-C-methyl-D-erythritol kinase [Ruminococcaceae bacterium]|nr:4-(cytidine 5'-diphospho)-2-C-methyl-D-erythritol kinase [Oscillospiraceae bacterium]
MQPFENQRTMTAHAKINLCLHVLDKRSDGYHNIISLMQMVDFGDEVTVRHTKEAGIQIETSNADLPTDSANIAYRAAALMQETYQLSGGFFIRLKKKIPVAAGLAGGSTNAAAVMQLINELCGLSLSVSELAALGVKLGADVPFCLYKKPALAEGIGERLTPVSGLKNCRIVLVNPGVYVSTATIYRELDCEKRPISADVQPLLAALSAGDLSAAFPEMTNNMQAAAQRHCPEIADLIEKLYAAGADHAMMSGSGATCFGIFTTEPDARRLQGIFGKQLVAVTKPII